jgi:hypothetical protein
MLWPLFARSVCSQVAPVLATRQMRELIGPLFTLSAWAQAAIVVVGTKGDSAALASVRSVGLFSG